MATAEQVLVTLNNGVRIPALGFGVWPLFQDSRWDGPHLAPFLRPEDLGRIVPESLWTDLS